MKITMVGLAGALLLTGAAAWASPLADMEAGALASADSLTLAELERDLAQQRQHMVNAESGARWTLGASLGQYQEPLTDTTARSYGAVNATAGLRIPVLGGAEASQRQRAEADKLVQTAQLQQAVKRDRVTRDVRLAYSAYVRSAEKAALARAWLGLEAAATPVFRARTREHALLETDRLALQSGFHVARRDLDRYLLGMQSALATLRRLSKLPLDALAPEPPAWATQCLQREALLQRLDQWPTVAIRQVELAARERQSGLRRWGGIEAGVTLQQSLVQDLGGQSGQGTVLGFDVSMPFDVSGANRAHASTDQLLLQQARLDLEVARAEETEAVDLALGTLHNSRSDLERSRQRLAVNLEADRIAMLRLHRLAGDVLEKALMARYELYLSAIDLTDTVQRTDAAQIDALAYGVVCADAPAEPDSNPSLPALLARPISTAVSVPPAVSPAETAWFLWQGDALLTGAELALPADSGRLLVSFTAPQLDALQRDAAVAQVLHRQIDTLHRRGWHVDLLFGDASYVLPEGQARLLLQVRAMAAFAFDGLNLDLERSDLPTALQPQWWRYALPTLRAVHAATPWPITLTTHFRELDGPSHQAELQQAGVRTVMAMVYVNDAQASTTIARRILARQAPLDVVLVQSVEPQLPGTDSSYASGRAASLARWQDIRQRLANMPHFQGIAVQSLDHFNAMQP